MINPPFLWTVIWIYLLVVFVLIIHKEKSRRLYLMYFIFGMVLGFYFDFFSFASGYYSYPGFFPFRLIGIPLSMTIAEGFSVAIAMKILKITQNLMEERYFMQKPL